VVVVVVVEEEGLFIQNRPSELRAMTIGTSTSQRTVTVYG